MLLFARKARDGFKVDANSPLRAEHELLNDYIEEVLGNGCWAFFSPRLSASRWRLWHEARYAPLPLPLPLPLPRARKGGSKFVSAARDGGCAFSARSGTRGGVRSTRLEHVLLAVSDLDRALQCYRFVYGEGLETRDGDVAERVWFDLARNTRIGLEPVAQGALPHFVRFGITLEAVAT